MPKVVGWLGHEIINLFLPHLKKWQIEISKYSNDAIVLKLQKDLLITTLSI